MQPTIGPYRFRLMKVIFFLTSIVSGLNDKLQSRGHPRIGLQMKPAPYSKVDAEDWAKVTLSIKCRGCASHKDRRTL